MGKSIKKIKMKHFFSVQDLPNLGAAVQRALKIKENPFDEKDLGKNKTIGLIFLNPSLRTRLSTQKAAAQLGMQVMVMNLNQEGWALETRDGVIMDGSAVEHLKEAAAVMGTYCDILALRSFPELKDKDSDYSESLFKNFKNYCKKPSLSICPYCS